MALRSSKRKTGGITSRKHRKRYSEVIGVFFKYGLGDVITAVTGQKIPLINKIEFKESDYVDMSIPERLRLAVEELDGAFIKVVQILSNRPDVIPPEYIEEFEKLQDNVPPFPPEQALEVLEEEFGSELSNILLMFDDKPLASGSIAQVHRGILHDGTPVALKIRRPNIEEKFLIDLDILMYLSDKVSKLPYVKSQFERSNPVIELVSEVIKELDFENELKNMEHFRKCFVESTDIYIPETYKEYSTEKVLTMEYVEGVKVTDTKNYPKIGASPEVVANKLVRLGLEQIFDHRFFHGDPHPGNIVILEDEKICFLDFGLMGKITNRQRENIVDLISAYSRNDARKLTRIMVKYIPKDLEVDEDEVENKVANLLDEYYGQELQDIDVGKALTTIISVILDYQITLNSNVYLLIKALSSYEGIGKRIYPEFDVTSHAEEFTKKIIREELSPKKIVKDIYFSTTDVIGLLRDLPGETRELLNALQGGRLKVNIRILELNDTIDYLFIRIDKVVNRLVVAIVLAAMIIGSALILRSTDVEGGVTTMVIIAAVGFTLALLIAFVMLISIIRSKGF